MLGLLVLLAFVSSQLFGLLRAMYMSVLHLVLISYIT